MSGHTRDTAIEHREFILCCVGRSGASEDASCDHRVLNIRSDEARSCSVFYALRARAPGNSTAWAKFSVAGQRRCVLLTGQIS
jgi:osmotically-inducible protein OsmY